MSSDHSRQVRPADRRLPQRAIHLAAHAVAASACGLAYPSLSLRSADCPLARGASVGRGPARNPLETEVIVALAGAEAEAIATGASVPCCADVAAWVTDGDGTEAEPFLEWLRLKAARTVEHPLRQRLIAAIANALVSRGELSDTEVGAIARVETGLYMRGQ